MEKDTAPKINLILAEKYAANTAIYLGRFRDESGIDESQNITDRIIGTEPYQLTNSMTNVNNSSASSTMWYVDVTFVVAIDGKNVFIPTRLAVNVSDNYVTVRNNASYYTTPSYVAYASATPSEENRIDYCDVISAPDFDHVRIALRGVYYNYIEEYDYEYNGEYVTSAYLGNYDTEEDAIAAGASNIKEQLFSYDGYYADFTQGEAIIAYAAYNRYYSGTQPELIEIQLKSFVFTVFDEYGLVHHPIYYIGIDTREVPSSPSDSTYFTVTGASKPNDSSGSTWLSTYKVRSQDDSYYRNGYQTVFILDDGQPYEGEALVPTFITGNGVVMHMDSDFMAEPSSDDTQISGESKVLFKDGRPIQYAAKSESGNELKNYWVTYVTQHRGGSKLFVNATNNEKAKVDGKAVREIFYNNDFGYNHDILIANVGDQPLTGINVELKDAKGVMLDPYWSVLDTSVKTLATFDSTSSPWSNELGQELDGELYNLAKIRLLPSLVYEDVYGGLYNENGEALYEKVRDVSYFGEISGTLTISADGNDPVEILLTGIAGTPKITTESLLDGVKYVPYSCLIMTNSMYDTGSMKFTIVDGALPKGIELMPDGELYGIPMESSEEGYTFTVEARFVGTAPTGTDISGFVDYKTYTLKVADNTDANVDAVNLEENQGYVLTDRVSKYVTVYYRSLNEDGTPVVEKIEIDSNLFHSEGELIDFKEFYIDGIKLTEGVDYIAEEGSTKITVLGETFGHIGLSDGNVPHTLAAEFRNDASELKHSAQNVYLSYLEYKEQHGGGTVVPSKPILSYNDQSSDAFEVVETIMTIVDANGNTVPDLKLELHSNVQYATTDESGNVRFNDVEFGRHTLYVTDSDNNTASKVFTIVTGFGAGLEGDIITAEVGQTVHITFSYDGNNLSILKAETETIDVVQASEGNAGENDNIQPSKENNPETGLVLGLVPITALAWILVFIKRR